MGARDAFLAAIVDNAVEPYRALVAPDVFERMRELMTQALATHPVASRLVDRARPRTDNTGSDDFAQGTLQPRERSSPETKTPAGSGEGEKP